MFRYFLAFLLINTCYQSLGNPIQPTQLLSKSLVTLASQCENAFLSSQLSSKIKDCAVFVPPYSKKQFQCLIFYDINKQLCSAVASSKLALTEDYLVKINEKQDVNTLCTVAKDWVFTNLSDFVNYKESAEKFFKLPATCGEVCGVEDTMNEANYYCKYYMWGLEMLKNQHVSTMASNNNNNAVAAPGISEPDSKADIPVPINQASDPINIKDSDTKINNGQIKQTEPTLAKTTPQKLDEVIDGDVAKSEIASQGTSKQPSAAEEAENVDKNEDADVNVNRLEDPSVAIPENVIPNTDQANKTNVVNEEKPAVVNDLTLPESGKDLPANVDQKDAVIDNPKPKPIGDTDDYADSEGNDNVGDDDGDDPGLDIKSGPDANQNNFIRSKVIVPPAHDVDVSQKEYLPNSMSGFPEDNDHFFPFFMTSIVLMVLLYVLYHNKSKVSKVFFGLILEGRQNGRRRNSRGHAYRRLDTLEQAMSANTAAPPSKIIY